MELTTLRSHAKETQLAPLQSSYYQFMPPQPKPPPHSFVYNVSDQFEALLRLYELLNKGDQESQVIKKKIAERAMRTLNQTSLPFSDSVKPFFNFDDSGEIFVTFLFDQPGRTPWSAIIDAYHGERLINLNRELYRLITTPDTPELAQVSRLRNNLERHFSTSTPRALRNRVRFDSSYDDDLFEIKEPKVRKRKSSVAAVAAITSACTRSARKGQPKAQRRVTTTVIETVSPTSSITTRSSYRRRKTQ
jgi:hypothetical protein